MVSAKSVPRKMKGSGETLPQYDAKLQTYSAFLLLPGSQHAAAVTIFKILNPPPPPPQYGLKKAHLLMPDLKLWFFICDQET